MKPIEQESHSHSASIDEMRKYLKELQMTIQLGTESPMPLAIVDKGMNYVVWSNSWANFFGVRIEKGDNHHEMLSSTKEEKREWAEVLEHERGKNGEFYFNDVAFMWEAKPIYVQGEMEGIIMMVLDYEKYTE